MEEEVEVGVSVQDHNRQYLTTFQTITIESCFKLIHIFCCCYSSLVVLLLLTIVEYEVVPWVLMGEFLGMHKSQVSTLAEQKGMGLNMRNVSR